MINSAKPPSDNRDVLDLYLKEARSQLEEQFRRSRGMDSRAGTVTALAAALAATAAIQLKDFSSAEPNGLSTWATVTAIVIATAYIVATVLSLIALLPRKKFSGPRLDNFLKGFDCYPETDPVRWTGKQVADSVTTNEIALRAKAWFVLGGIVCAIVMGLGTILLGIAVNYG